MKFQIAGAVLMSLGLLHANDPAKNPKAAAYEQRFLDKMPAHHEGGVEMAKACTEKATRDDLKEFCRQMIASQESENGQMQNWRKAWYDDQGGMSQDDKSQMATEHEQMMKKINASSGPAFDKAFLSFMIIHHQQALAEAKACTAQAEHAELKDLCGKIAADQQKEIAKMQGWYKTLTGAMK